MAKRTMALIGKDPATMNRCPPALTTAIGV